MCDGDHSVPIGLLIRFPDTMFLNKDRDKPKEKKDRIPATVDFVNTSDVDVHMLFAEGTTSINITKAAEKDMELDGDYGKFLLPEDYEYSMADLLKLFMKPRRTVGGLESRGSSRDDRLSLKLILIEMSIIFYSYGC